MYNIEYSSTIVINGILCLSYKWNFMLDFTMKYVTKIYDNYCKFHLFIFYDMLELIE